MVEKSAQGPLIGTMFMVNAEPGKVSGAGSYTIQKHLFFSIYGKNTQEIQNLGGPPKPGRLVSSEKPYIIISGC